MPDKCSSMLPISSVTAIVVVVVVVVDAVLRLLCYWVQPTEQRNAIQENRVHTKFDNHSRRFNFVCVQNRIDGEGTCKEHYAHEWTKQKCCSACGVRMCLPFHRRQFSAPMGLRNKCSNAVRQPETLSLSSVTRRCNTDYYYLKHIDIPFMRCLRLVNLFGILCAIVSSKL